MNKLFARFTLAVALLAAFCLPAHAQVALPSTTLSSALGTPPDNGPGCFSVASATGIVSPGFTTPNYPTGNQTVLFTDREAIFVTSLNGTYVCGVRGWGSGKATPHVTGAVVYVASPNQFTNIEKVGACNAANEPYLPQINLTTGNIFDCKSSGQWIMVGNGTMDPAGNYINTFCTGTAGTAETEFLNGVACSAATTQTFVYTIPYAGTLANFRASASANFLGTGGSTFTVKKNGSATTIVCAPTAATKVCTDTTHSVAVVAGDLISISFLSATSDTAANLSVTLGLF